MMCSTQQPHPNVVARAEVPAQRRHDERPLLDVVEYIAGRPAPGPLALLLAEFDQCRT